MEALSADCTAHRQIGFTLWRSNWIWVQHFYFLCFYLCDFKIVTDGRPATAAGDCVSTLPCLWRRCFFSDRHHCQDKITVTVTVWINQKFQQQCFAETHISSIYCGADTLIIDIQWYALAAHVMFSLLCVQNSFFNLTVLSSDIIIILNSTLLFVNVYREEILTFLHFIRGFYFDWSHLYFKESRALYIPADTTF